MSNGLLKTTPGITSQGNYLPTTFANNQSDICSKTDSSIKCFEAGDSRGTENLGLASMHTLFMREHNRIAKKLALINPSWGDFKLFHGARQIVTAIYQHIIYNEWLPATIGIDPKSPDLQPKPLNTYFTGYDPTVIFIFMTLHFN
jgi:peroxidase